MNFNNIKNISAGPSFFRRLLAVGLCVAVIFGSYNLLKRSGADAIDTIDVVRVRRNGLNARSVIAKDNVERYSLIRREFNDDMVKYEDLGDVLGNFTLYFIRGRTVLYHDQLTEKSPLKNEWLYDLGDQYEVLTVPYNYLECGGDILSPGDNIRVRATYESSGIQNDNLINSPSSNRGSLETRILFDEIEVIDLLNARGRSIYEVYREVSDLPDDQRQEEMKSNDFLSDILPRSFVLKATKSQVDEYARFSGRRDLKLTFTILNREGGENIGEVELDR